MFSLLSHTNYRSQKRQHFALSLLFSSPLTALFLGCLFSLSGSLLVFFLFFLCGFLVTTLSSICDTLLLPCSQTLMRHTSPCFYKQVCRPTSILGTHGFLTPLQLEFLSCINYSTHKLPYKLELELLWSPISNRSFPLRDSLATKSGWTHNI